MSGNLYSFANLGGTECGLFRLRGVGLANCLFPWARCVLKSREFGLKRIAPTWPQLCHRQWMRWDRDKRCYLGLMDESRDAIHGPRKLALLATQPRIAERDFLSDPEAFQRGVVLFAGIEGYFASMLEDHAIVRDLLCNMTRPRHRVGLQSATRESICLHVRYGDFLESYQPGVPQPMNWFLHVLDECRTHLGRSAPALVFSDASDQQLAPLLERANVRRAFFGSSIADLLAMSAAPLLIASGSSFSMWASYLGRMPVIWPPGQRRQRLHGGLHEYEPEVGFEPLPGQFVSLIRERFARGRFARAQFA